MNILYDFSSALLQARQRKDATQEQIAFALDISQATYNAWECGHRIEVNPESWTQLKGSNEKGI